MNLQTSVKDASRVYKMYASRLKKLGIFKVEDFLFHVPFLYEDFSLVSDINKVQAGEIVTVKGIVKEIKNEFTRRYKKIQKAKVDDGTGTINVVWFNQPYLLNTIKKGRFISLSGKVEESIGLTLKSPAFEIIEENQENIHTGRLISIYPETRGVSSKWLRRQIFRILNDNENEISDYLPKDLLDEHCLIDLRNAFREIHFPDSLEKAQEARKRLAFDELFLIQLNVFLKRSAWEKTKKGFKFSLSNFEKEIEKFMDSLPFELTNAQKKSVREIFTDMSLEKPMNRLLEGDVGIYLAFLNGYQSILMAPTEILASQHYQTLSALFKKFGLKVGLATSGKKVDFKKGLNVLIGTHAVLSKKIELKNLGFVIIDEQQRFGVEQRSLARQ